MSLHDIDFDGSLIARSLDDLDRVSEPGQFAWEILRRRADYVGATSRTISLSAARSGETVELIEVSEQNNRWGLGFRRKR